MLPESILSREMGRKAKALIGYITIMVVLGEDFEG